MTTARLIADVGALLYLGPIGQVPPHRCPGTVVAVGIDGPIELTIGGVRRELRCATTPAGVVRSVSSDAARVAVTLIDPAWRAREVVDHDATELTQALERLWGGFSPAAWDAYLEQLGCRRRGAAVDARVRAVAQRLSQTHDNASSSAALAAGVGLSASRLQHLFTEHIGVPMRAYRRWTRFQQMARVMAAGENLTGAAHSAGFHDSAHMNRAFRQAFGIVPSFVFRPGLVIDVVEREG